MSNRIQIAGIDPPGRAVALVAVGGQWEVGMEVEMSRRLWRVDGVRPVGRSGQLVHMVEVTVPYDGLRWAPTPIHYLMPREPAANQPKRNAAARAAGLRKLRGRW